MCLRKSPWTVIRNGFGTPSSKRRPYAVGSSGSLNFNPRSQPLGSKMFGEPQQIDFRSYLADDLKDKCKTVHSLSSYNGVLQGYRVSMWVEPNDSLIPTGVCGEKHHLYRNSEALTQNYQPSIYLLSGSLFFRLWDRLGDLVGFKRFFLSFDVSFIFLHIQTLIKLCYLFSSQFPTFTTTRLLELIVIVSGENTADKTLGRAALQVNNVINQSNI